MEIGYEQRIKEILGGVPENIYRTDNLKNFSYIVEDKHKKYFFKFLKEEKIKKELFGINYFRQNLNVQTPKVIFQGEDFIVTNFEEGLEKINSIQLIQIIKDYQQVYFDSKTPCLLPTRFSREKIFRAYKRNKEHFFGFKTKGLLNILEGIGESSYLPLQKIVSHGDTHNKNIFLTKRRNPFILDFENLSSEYPTFDISTAIFYASKDAKIIIQTYLSSPKRDILSKICKNSLIDLIIADTLRITIWDTLNIKKKIKQVPNPEKRIYNHQKIFDLFL